MKHLKQMLNEPDLHSVLAAPLKDAISHVWPSIRKAQRSGDFELAEMLIRHALEGAMPTTIAIFEARAASAIGELH
ncbi:hypothetical protein X735_12580 [Mesorhizobium sp. L2C085B000]|uniref:hypothetical protein n=1 Tax=Mesorhizobium sp. L2C085B000 TaxID=1287117 RepID=UPI0003D06494|nr:hypothetical protein [Mesorhizobium sp. L2C085B000]ESZ17796.1 hypothetical protein X735_12580 [Mesorhizobium sp. L2C085B000]